MLKDVFDFKYEYNVDDSLRFFKIGIVGFGNFGQFLVKRMVKQGYNVLVYLRIDYIDVVVEFGVLYYLDFDDLFEEYFEVIFLCMLIFLIEKVFKLFLFQRLKRSMFFVDVFFVKEFLRNVFF